MDDRWVTVGIITAPHGVKGAVRVLPKTDFPERFFSTEAVYVAIGGERTAMKITQAFPLARGMIGLHLDGITDRTEAEQFRRALLQVTRDETVPLPEGTYYVYDLVGCTVVTVDGMTLGRLHDVLETGANDVYVVRADDGREWLIPVLQSVVIDVNIPGRRITVDPMPGLID